MNTTQPTDNKSITTFFILTFIISLPVYLLCYMASKSIVFPKEMMYVSIAIITITPLSAALLLTIREKGWKSAKQLFRNAFDLKRITKKIWYVPTLLLLPLICILGLGIMYFIKLPIPAATFPLKSLPFVVILFFILAFGEEVGWMGFAYQPMQARWNDFKATLILGLVWTTWHIPFFIIMMSDPAFIIAQCFGLLGIRFLLVWIFSNTGKSVFAAILFHAVYNVTIGVLPNYNVNPPTGIIITVILILLGATIVTLLSIKQSTDLEST